MKLYFAMSDKGMYHAYFSYRRIVCRPLAANQKAITEPVTMLAEDAPICSACLAWLVQTGSAVTIGGRITLRSATLQQ